MPLPPASTPLARLALPLAVALLPAAGAAQVYKCVDRAGHTTYQQSPCTGSQSGAAIELSDPVLARPGAPSSEKAEAMWQAAAREGRAVVGMPKPFVTQGMGAPAEIRAPRNGEGGGEVWVYPKGAQVTRIGFLDNVVAWMRTDATAPEKPAATPATPASAALADRETRVREALTVGKTCTAALQDAGPPDRDESLVVGQGASSASRYVYVFDSGDANAYAAFVCVNGRVTSVERFLPERVAPVAPKAVPR
ncbi:MAG: DUF4124 domain-containing protein [Betaproteobacteria bacterium]|jgi:hypothetical protein|nr:DUF4124 domain-containing protein [Betaproteobacteria bacterium]